MRGIRLTYVRVEKGSAPTEAILRPGVAEVSPFLSAHLEGLRDRARDGSAANAAFYDPPREQLIEDLRTGTDDAFLAATNVLAARLADEMTHVNPAPGLLVCTTMEAEAGGDRFAAVLKLEVVSAHGAVLRRLETGEETLAAVTDVLDRPGDLQKGLVYPDERPSSAAVVGDASTQNEARYFLRALGVTLEARENRSAAAFVGAIRKFTDSSTTRLVVAALPSVSSGPPPQVLDELSERSISLSDTAKAAIAAELSNAERPVRLGRV
ncbi:MAG: hypothetical protein Q7V58_12270 [Actinomycetota bacterium]|nr:hypothetical protein [Actinomycetota bacterium]